MNKLFWSLLAAILVVCILFAAVLISRRPSQPAFSQPRVATIRLQKVFASCQETKQASAALKQGAAEMEQGHSQLVGELEKAKGEWQQLVNASAGQQGPSTAETRRTAAEQKLREIKSLENKISEFDRQAKASLAARKESLRKPILDTIQAAIAGIARARGYAIVIDSGAQTYIADPVGQYYVPGVLFSSDDTDLTDAVVAELKKVSEAASQ